MRRCSVRWRASWPSCPTHPKGARLGLNLDCMGANRALRHYSGWGSHDKPWQHAVSHCHAETEIMSIDKWEDVRHKHLIPIAYGCKITLNNHKRRFHPMRNPTPNHYGPPSPKSVDFAYASVRISLTKTSIHSLPPIWPLKRKSRLITEHYTPPVETNLVHGHTAIACGVDVTWA